MTTLADQARAQEGEPIPNDELVRVELRDSHGNVVEYHHVSGDFNADELASWTGEYVKSMAAEGMPGSVRWWPFPRPATVPMSVDEARAVTRAPIEVGKQYEFYAEMQEDHKPQEERMRRFTGQTVTVVRPLRGLGEPDPEYDWFEPTEDEEPEISRGFIVRAADGSEFPALEEELNGWDRDLGQFFWPDGTHGWDHDTRFLVNERETCDSYVDSEGGGLIPLPGQTGTCSTCGQSFAAHNPPGKESE